MTANELVASIHDRIPVILEPADDWKWLGEKPAEPESLLGRLEPYPAARMEPYRVGLNVNGVANDEAKSLELIG